MDSNKCCLVEFGYNGSERLCERDQGHDGSHRGPLLGSYASKVYRELRDCRRSVGMTIEETLAIKIHIEATRHNMEPEAFLARVLNEWQDARYSGTPVPKAEGYSGVRETRGGYGGPPR